MTELRRPNPGGPSPAPTRSLTAVIAEWMVRPAPGLFTDRMLWAQLIRHARCAGSGLDPDQWFPASADPDSARREAAAALAVCTACPVRSQCLALSLRHWDIGQHGIWGGLVAADRAAAAAPTTR